MASTILAQILENLHNGVRLPLSAASPATESGLLEGELQSLLECELGRLVKQAAVRARQLPPHDRAPTVELLRGVLERLADRWEQPVHAAVTAPGSTPSLAPAQVELPRSYARAAETLPHGAGVPTTLDLPEPRTVVIRKEFSRNDSAPSALPGEADPVRHEDDPPTCGVDEDESVKSALRLLESLPHPDSPELESHSGESTGRSQALAPDTPDDDSPQQISSSREVHAHVEPTSDSTDELDERAGAPPPLSEGMEIARHGSPAEIAEIRDLLAELRELPDRFERDRAQRDDRILQELDALSRTFRNQTTSSAPRGDSVEECADESPTPMSRVPLDDIQSMIDALR